MNLKISHKVKSDPRNAANLGPSDKRFVHLKIGFPRASNWDRPSFAEALGSHPAHPAVFAHPARMEAIPAASYGPFARNRQGPIQVQAPLEIHVHDPICSAQIIMSPSNLKEAQCQVETGRDDVETAQKKPKVPFSAPPEPLVQSPTLVDPGRRQKGPPHWGPFPKRFRS